MKESFRIRLLDWWEDNKRTFPWRETKDPYKILCSEILLQQTNAEKVIPVYNIIISSYPDIKSLSEAETNNLKEIIRPLGLIKRAERLKKISAIISKKYNYKIPKKIENLLELPGIGNYTAHAVICFAFEKKTGILDTNTIRILNRVFDIQSNKARPRNDKELQSKLNDIIPQNDSRSFNYALLDFAALICKSKNPYCQKCIINDICINPVNLK